jgi:hypothetical protein
MGIGQFGWSPFWHPDHEPYDEIFQGIRGKEERHQEDKRRRWYQPGGFPFHGPEPCRAREQKDHIRYRAVPIRNGLALVHDAHSSKFHGKHDRHASGTPIIVEAKLDTALLFIACHVDSPNHFLHRSPSTTITGMSSMTIAGNVRKIIGTPASASNGTIVKASLIPSSMLLDNRT